MPLCFQGRDPKSCVYRGRKCLDSKEGLRYGTVGSGGNRHIGRGRPALKEATGFVIMGR